MPFWEPGFYGTNADGTDSSDYCMFCYQAGKFVKPDITLDEMIEESVSFMVKGLELSEAEARVLSRTLVPTLKRWQK